LARKQNAVSSQPALFEYRASWESAHFSQIAQGCRPVERAEKRAFCFRANRITRNLVIIDDQLKMEATLEV